MFGFVTVGKLIAAALVLPQCEFYPLREQDRGLLYRYADQPLFVNPDLPEDLPSPQFETRRHRYWGEWFSQADWNECERLGADFGFDGFGFFPRPHRVRFWDAMEKSPLKGFYEVPIAHNYSQDGSDLAKWFGYAINSSRAYRINGKVLILSYRFSNENSPDLLKRKLDRMRNEFGDTFLFVCDISRYLLNTDKPIKEEDKAIVRAYLRVCDGVIVGDVFSVVGFEGPARNRVFNSAHYRAAVDLLKDTLAESEFRGKKLLGLAACIAHENTSRQFWTASEDGLRTLTESLMIAAEANPDIILLPEWDELNENTCVGPTLMNGLSVKRVMNYAMSKIKQRELRPLANDNLSMPNLIVSYRRNVSPGEKLVVDVLNVPDGARSGELKVSVEILDEDAKTLVKYPEQSTSESELKHLRFIVDSAALKSRAPRVSVYWQTENEHGVISEGLTPIDLQPANGWCLKEVHQPIRELAPIKVEHLSVNDGRLTAALSCSETIRYAYVTGNGDIQRVFGRSADAFTEDETNAVFQIYGMRPTMLDRQAYSYSVEGVDVAEWLDRHGVHTGLVYNTDWIGTVGDPYFLRIRKEQLETAILKINFREQREVRLKDAFVEGGYMALASEGEQFAITRFRRQPRYPSVANEKDLSFECMVDGDRNSMMYYVQVVTMSGKTWRSRPFVVEPNSELAKMRVFSAIDGDIREILLPKVRIPDIAYEPNERTGAYLPTKDRKLHFATVLGGRYTPLTLWNRTAVSSMDYPEGFVPNFSKSSTAAPKVIGDVLEFDGIDDFIVLPWESVPQNSAYKLSMDVLPRSNSESYSMLISKSLLNLKIDHGELVVSVPGAKNVRTGLKLVANEWQKLSLEHRGDSFEVNLGDRPLKIPAKLPSTFMSPVAIQFSGSIRNITINSSL